MGMHGGIMRKVGFVVSFLAVFTGFAVARPVGYTCGIWLKHHLGGRYTNDRRLDLALNWKRILDRTVAAPGAVVVQTRSGRALGGGPGGHVSVIRELRGGCRALVQDNRGTYLRDICKNNAVYVRP